MVDAYDLDMVESADPIKSWWKKFCMLAVVDCTLCATVWCTAW